MANKPKPAQPIKRNGYWYLVRRAPQRLPQLDGRYTHHLEHQHPGAR